MTIDEAYKIAFHVIALVQVHQNAPNAYQNS